MANMRKASRNPRWFDNEARISSVEYETDPESLIFRVTKDGAPAGEVRIQRASEDEWVACLRVTNPSGTKRITLRNETLRVAFSIGRYLPEQDFALARALDASYVAPGLFVRSGTRLVMPGPLPETPLWPAGTVSLRLTPFIGRLVRTFLEEAS